MDEIGGRVAKLEERINHMPTKDDLSSTKDATEGKVSLLRSEVREMMAKEVQALADAVTERLGNMRAAIMSELAVERAEFKKEVLEEFQKHMKEMSEAQDRIWKRIGIVASILPIVIICLLWAAGTISATEAASAAAGAI